MRYEYLKEALVKGWRTVFENDELSFYWVQLANFQKPAKETPGAELTHFSIQDAAGAWHRAKAAIVGGSVLVWHDDVKDPAHVRFGYQSNPVGINLYNKEGLPASPFATD